MCVKKILSLIFLLLFCLFSAFSQDVQELSSLESPSTSQEILIIADAIMNIADKWDAHQHYLNQLTVELESSKTDSQELRLTLEKTQETYADLRNDYGLLQLKLQKWKTISLVFGVTSVISVGTTIFIMTMN